MKIKMTQSDTFEVNRDPVNRTRLKKAAGYICLFCLSAFLIYFSVKGNDKPTEEENLSTRSADRADIVSEKNGDIQCRIVRGCDIDCSQGDTTKLNEILLELSEDCPTITKLYMHSCNFPGYSIPKLWLRGSFKIKHLSILNCGVEEIEDEAFNTNVFHETQKLYLNNFCVRHLRPATFLGLYSLIELTVTVESSTLTVDNFLKPIQGSLESIKFAFKNRQLPVQAIFGETIMQSLRIVDLRGNAFGDTLNETAFDSLPLAQSLYLSSSQIETIPEGTFRSLSGSLGLLDLSANPLTYLSPKLFEDFLGRASFSVQLSQTRLNCDLTLVPFAEVYEEHRRNFREMATCFTPLPLRGYEVNSTLIRNSFNTSTEPPTTVTTPSSTTSISDDPSSEPTSVSTETTSESGSNVTETPTSSTTENSSGNQNENVLVNLDCDCCTDKDCIVGRSNVTKSFRMGAQNVRFTLEAVSSSTIRLGDLLNYSQYTIVWFDDSAGLRTITSDKLGCISPFSRQEVRIHGLAPNRTYTFCLVKDTAYWISPFDCQSVHIPPEILSVSWIGDNSREFTIAMFAVGSVCSMLFGCLLAYCIIRCKVSLAGRKRMDLRCNFPVKRKQNPRTRIGSDDTNPVESCKSPKVHRKISTISNGSGGISYVVPNTYEVIKPDKSLYLSNETVFIDTIPSNSPPPLPKRTYTMIYQKKNVRPAKPRSDSYA